MSSDNWITLYWAYCTSEWSETVRDYVPSVVIVPVPAEEYDTYFYVHPDSHSMALQVWKDTNNEFGRTKKEALSLFRTKTQGAIDFARTQIADLNREIAWHKRVIDEVNRMFKGAHNGDE